jgi:DNA-binding FadR family transcriptional regulator
VTAYEALYERHGAVSPAAARKAALEPKAQEERKIEEVRSKTEDEDKAIGKGKGKADDETFTSVC